MPLYQTHHIGPIESTYSVVRTAKAISRFSAQLRTFGHVSPVGGTTATTVSVVGEASDMPKVRRWAVKRLIALAVLTTLYVLSIGPMWWVWYSGMYVSTESNYLVIVFYEPLRLACHIEWIDRIVTAYIEWWIL